MTVLIMLCVYSGENHLQCKIVGLNSMYINMQYHTLACVFYACRIVRALIKGCVIICEAISNVLSLLQ